MAAQPTGSPAAPIKMWSLSLPLPPPSTHDSFPLSLHRRRRPDRSRQDQPHLQAGRAPGRGHAAGKRRRQPVSAALLSGTQALRAADAAAFPVRPRAPAARPGAGRPVPRRHRVRLPDRQGHAVRTAEPRRRRVRAVSEGLRRPRAAGADARPGDLPAGAARRAAGARQAPRHRIRAQHGRGLPAAPGQHLQRVLPPLRRGAAADGQHQQPQLRAERGRLRTAARAHGQDARPARILQPGGVTMATTLSTLKAMRSNGEKIAVLTCYDASFARVLDAAGVDVLLVGDSLGMVVQGHATTLPVKLAEMAYHTRCVAAGTERAFIVADLPFGSYQPSPEHAFAAAARLMAAGAHMVKLEGGTVMVDTVAFLTQRGIPVCAHLGLLPQSVNQLGGYRVQGREDAAATQLIADARALEAAGAG